MNEPRQITLERQEQLDGETLGLLVEYGRAALGESALDEWLLPVIAAYGWLYIAWHEKEIVGSVEIIRGREEDELYLEGIYIRPEHQGQGYGKQLLGSVMAVLADQGYARIWATLDPANGAGGALYQALGFKATEKLPDHYGPGRDRMLLVARLEGADNG